MPITPTVGRKVYFYADHNQTEPHDATILKVRHEVGEDGQPIPDNPDTSVNLQVTNPDTGVVSFVTDIRVGDGSTQFAHYRWMPYQIGQAAKSVG